jgi:hypothetical protein
MLCGLSGSPASSSVIKYLDGFTTEDGGSRTVLNAGSHSPYNTSSHPKRPELSSTLLLTVSGLAQFIFFM